MAYNPNFPADHQALAAAPWRDQFNALKALIDAQQTQITALQSAISTKVDKAGMGEFDPGYSDPPTYQDLMKIQAGINDIITAMN